jgi:hypothetical protein
MNDDKEVEQVEFEQYPLCLNSFRSDRAKLKSWLKSWVQILSPWPSFINQAKYGIKIRTF